MGPRNTIALPGMLTPIAASAVGSDITRQHETLRTSGSGYAQLYSLMDAGNFAQNLTVERSDLCGDVIGDGVIDRGDVVLLANYVGYSGCSLNCTT